jgi:hypothetical protein
MNNKQGAIKFLQDLPADEDAVVLIFTKADAATMIDEDSAASITDENWNEIVRLSNKVWPSDDMWESFGYIVTSAVNEINEEDEWTP